MEHTEFRDHFRIFTSTTDPVLHEQVILAFFDPLDLDIEYRKLRKEGGIARVLDIFSSFAALEDDELVSDYEKKSLEQVGVLTVQYFEEGNYLAFAQMVLAMTIESLADKYMPVIDDDLNEIDMDMLYSKIPSEIYLQTFLLENMAEPRQFDWNRDPQIVEQALIALTVIFSDIYDFISAEEIPSEESAD
jgi:hypothetical protein